MTDPLGRLSAADPERNRETPMTPPFTPKAETRSPLRGPLIAVAAALVVVVGVGVPAWLLGGSPDGPPAAGDSTTTTMATTTTTVPTTTTEAPATTTTTTGGAVEWLEIGQPAGAELAPISVPAGETLALLADPDPGAAVVAELGFDDRVVATGRIGIVGDHAFYEVTHEGATVYAPTGRLSSLGVVLDITSEIVDYLGGIPTAGDLESLVQEVLPARGGGPHTIVVAPTVGDLGEVVVDLVEFMDDAVWGERLHIFATLEGGVWGLRSVEATTLCLRGTDPDGFCN